MVTHAASAGGSLTPGDHLLLKLRGEAVHRHAVVVRGVEGGDGFWVMTPARHIELLELSSSHVTAAKLWNGKDLPATVDAVSTKIDKDSPHGKFTAAEIRAGSDLAKAQPVDAPVGTRVKLPGYHPTHRVSTKKSPVLPFSSSALSRSAMSSLLEARVGKVDISGVADAKLVDLQKAIDEADKLFAGGRPVEAKRGLLLCLTSLRGWGKPADVARPAARTDLEGEPLAALDRLLPGEGYLWVVNDPLHADFGRSVDLQPGSVVLGAYGVSFRGDGDGVSVQRMELEKVVSFVNDALAKLKAITADGAAPKKLGEAARPAALDPRDLRARFDAGRPAAAVPLAEPAQGAPAAKPDAPAAAEDARTLWVLQDDHGERFRTWRSFCRDAVSHSFGDGWSKHHEGPGCALDLFTNWDRLSMDPMVWLSNFLRDMAINIKERTAIELRTLVRAVWLFGTYDQVNGPSLAGVEELCRRICQLVEAYHAGEGTGKPNWASVKHMTSQHSTSNVVPTIFRTFAHKKCKEEVEIENLRLRASNATPVPLGGDDDPSSSLPFVPRAKAKSKAAARRQLEAGAAEKV